MVKTSKNQLTKQVMEVKTGKIKKSRNRETLDGADSEERRRKRKNLNEMRSLAGRDGWKNVPW